MSISIDLSKILEKCCFSEASLTKRKLTDGADWARLQAEAKLSEYPMLWGCFF